MSTRSVSVRDRLETLTEHVTTATDRSPLPVEAPFTGETLAETPTCIPDDVDLAVERARDAQSSWAERPIEARVAVFEQFHERLLDDRGSILNVMQAETGKARADAFIELVDAVQNVRYYAARAPELLEPESRSGAVPGLTSATVTHRPIGVVGIISPWNYPLTLSISDAVPALLAGNAVVLKPDEQAPFVALLAVELLRECGLPRDALQVVTGSGADLGSTLIEGVDFVGFTGSAETGSVVAAQAGEHLTPCSLELGGKNPLLVLDDADVEKAARGAVEACFSNAGQLCISAERLYVHHDVYGDFLDAFVGATRELTLGARFDFEADVGSLVSAQQLQKVRSHVDDAVEKGADVLTGGRVRPDLGPHFYEPTVLTGVTERMTCYEEETFGPVAAVYEVESVDEAVRLANDSEFGLNGSVWTSDPKRGESVAARIDCGSVAVNDAYLSTYGAVDAPMGGVGRSGFGRRHGEEGFLKYTNAQTIGTNRGPVMSAPGRLPDGAWSDGMTAYLRLRERFSGWWP